MFLSWEKLLCVTGWILRVISQYRSNSKELSYKDLARACERIVGLYQKEVWGSTYEDIKNEKIKRLTPALASLNPKMNEKGIIIKEGRCKEIYQADIPIIPDGPLAFLLLEHAHKKTLCGSIDETLSFWRWRYEILGRNRLAKEISKRCVVCVRYRGKPLEQRMGPQPYHKLKPSFPFGKIAIDYAGPFKVKGCKLRGFVPYKAWVMIAVCLTTKAVHIELVGDQSGMGTLFALLRMTARRGTPCMIRSDNGTNFKYAQKIVAASAKPEERLETQEENKKINNFLQKDISMARNDFIRAGVVWEFSPPYAPNFNPGAEAHVKCMKRHLIPLLDKRMRTFEEFSTILTSIEATLNTRPLCRYNEDWLTPGHFLIGRHLRQIPCEPDEIELPEAFKRYEELIDSFWKAWLKTMIERLDKRSKWRVATKNVKVGDIVLLSQADTPRGRWPMARVVEVKPGKDGLVRVCGLQDANKGRIMERSIRHLVALPVNEGKIDKYEYVQGIRELQDSIEEKRKVPSVETPMEVGGDIGKTENLDKIIDNQEEKTVGKTIKEKETNKKRKKRQKEEWVAHPINQMPEPPPGFKRRKTPRKFLRLK